MALPNEPQIEREVKDLGGIGVSPSVPSDNFTFTPSSSWLDTPMTEEFTESLDPAYLAQIDHYQPIIEQYAPSSLANLNTPYPGQSVGQYDPRKQVTPPDMSTAEGSIRGLQLAMNSRLPQGALGQEKPQIADPIYSSRKATAFDRYYEHPQFAKLGFHPYANNEEYYNLNSDIFDDMSRMWGQFGKLVGSGFMSTYRSIGDLFDSNDDYFTTPDLQTATEFEDAMAIGMSTRGGFGGFANNLLLNSGYTVGIIGSIAMEELILAGATALTVGGASPALAAGTARNVGRLGQVITNAFKMPRLAKATRNMLKTLNQTDNARSFWQATKAGEWGVMGTLFLPETMAAVKSFKTGKNAAQNMTNLAKMSAGFGGFYRDLRSVNYAFAESKLEGGMVYNQQVQNGMAIEQAKLLPGETITPEMMAGIRENAEKASFATIMMNAPLIYLSNRVVLDNALGGANKSIGRLMNDKITGAGRKIIQTTKTIGKDGKIAKNVFEYAGDGLRGFGRQLKAAGVKGSLQMGLGASARYFAANLMEGVQEVGQEAISMGTKGYYSNLQNDPMMGGADLTSASISSAIDSQFSEQGIETFLSGFLMGGIVQGPQKLLFQGIPNLYTRVTSPEKYKEYKDNKKKFYDALTQVHNNAWNAQAEDPGAIFDLNKLNFLVQKEVAAEMKQSAYNNDMFGFQDAKDFGKFQQMYTIFQNGTADLFRSQIQDYLNLTDEELNQAFPSSKSEIKSGKMRKRMEGLLLDIDKAEKLYFKNKDKFENPYDSSQFKKGTREYNDEYLKERAFEHARYLSMFTEDGFTRALERADSIYNELAADPILSKVQANDITVLLDPDTLDNELNTLAAEIAVLEDTKENEKIKKEKLTKLQKLTAIRQILTDPKNLGTSGANKGIYDRRKMPQLRKAFEQYVQFLADSKDGFADKSRIDEVLKKIVDYKALKGRARVYDKAIQYLANPERLNEIVERQYAINKELFKKNRTDILERIKKYVNKVEANELLNQLMKLDVYPDAEQAEMFLKTGDARYLQLFFNENGVVDPKLDKELYAQILDKIDVYTESTKVEEVATEEEQEAEAKTKKSTDKIDEILDSADIDSPVSRTFGSNDNVNPIVKTLLNKLFRKYKRTQQALKKRAKSDKEWLNSTEAVVANKAYEALKQMWYQSIKDKYNSQDELDQVYKTDDGFISWLMTQETNPDVRNILEEANLTFNDFYNYDTAEDIADDVDVEYDGKPVVTGVGYVVIKVDTVDKDNKPVTYYQIKTKDNKDISDEVAEAAEIPPGATFTKLNAASKKMNELDELIPTESTFEFDGETLYNGATVTDSKGNKFIVTSSPKSLSKYKNLSLIPVGKETLKGKERKAATVIVKPGEFKNEYEVEKLNFNQLPKNVARLSQNEAVRPFAHENANESREEAFRRYDAVMDELTPEERATIEIVVKRNPNAGNVIQEEFQVGDKEANQYIRRVSDAYIIGLRIGDPEVKKKIDGKLKERGIQPTDQPDGIFAYMPNNGVQIFNTEGVEIDPRQIDQQTAANTFFSSEADALNKIRDNFAVQANMIEFVEEKLGNKDEVVIQLFELADPGFSFYLSSRFSQSTSPKSLNDLAYNTVDGNIIILDNRVFTTKDENGKTITERREDWKTSISDVDQETEIIEKIKADLQQRVVGGRNMYEVARNMGAYVAIIKSPNGEYTLAELKPTEATEEAVTDYFKKIVDRAAQTREENLSDPAVPAKAKRKNLGYNVDFNTAIKEEMFISTQPGYNITISVDPGGRIEFNILDKATGQKLLVHEKGKLKGKPNPIVINQSAVSTVSDQENYMDALTEALDALNATSVAKALKIKITTESFRQSFDKNASANTIVESTTTTLDDRVRYDYRLILQQDSSNSQASQNTPGNANQASKKSEQEKKNAKTLEEKLAEMSAQDVPVTDEVTETEYNDFVNNGVVKEERIEAIARKIMGQQTLTERELAIMADKTTAINDKIAELAASDPEVSFEKQKQDLKDAIEARKKKIISEGDRKTLKKRLKEDKELKALQNQLNNLLANKVISPDMSIGELEDINTFRSWAAANLPTFISIDDIMTLGNNMKAGGVRVGAFVLSLHDLAGGMDVKGTIYTGANSPFRYHEAFHGVFRMLLTEEEISKYLSIARREVREKLRREGKDFKTELEKFRNSADTYAEMSEQRLIEEYYEEYLADQFELFKTNPSESKTSSENKSLFTRILEWIRAVLGSYSRNELTELFENIDAGKYKSATVVQNRFTEAVLQGITIEANALIPVEEVEVGDKKGYTYLDPDAANSMIRSMAAIYISREEKNTDSTITREQLLDKVIEDFKTLYDPESEANEMLSTDQILALVEYSDAFEQFPEEIKNSVAKLLNLADINLEERIFVAEEKEDSEGLRGVDEWDKDASLVGGFSSLSAKLRRYIMTTTVEEADMFGNVELTPGEKLIVPVDFNEAYNGLLKAVKNTTDPNKILQQIYLFGQNNPQTNAVVNRLFSDLGLTQESIAEGNWENGVKNPLFFNALIKGLENFRVDYIFIHRNNNGRVVTYSAATRDDANSQIDRWGQAYSLIYRTRLKIDKAFRTEAEKAIGKLQRQLSEDKVINKISDEALNKKAAEYVEIFREYLGIQLSQQYIAYNLIQQIENLTPNQQLIKDNNEGTELIDPEMLSNLRGSIKTNTYIFSTQDSGMTSHLKRLSMANAPFDETVGASVFKNANGDLVYAHQKPTFHLKKIAALNDPEALERMKEDDEFLSNNWLLNDEGFIQLAREGRLRAIRISGGKKGNIDITEDGLEESGGTGKTYGDFTAKDFVTNLLNAYTYLFNPATGKLDGTILIEDDTQPGGFREVATAPVLIRVIEASNTGDMMGLPVIKAVQQDGTSVTITDEAFNGYKNNIKAEFERIKRESNEETRTDRDIENYNKGQNRATQFIKTASLLTPAREIDTYTKGVVAKTSAAQVSRITEGTQDVLVYNTDTAQRILKYTEEGEVRQATIQEAKKPGNKVVVELESLGAVKIDNEKALNEMVELLGDAIHDEPIEGLKRQHPVRIGEATFYVESGDLRAFLKGEKTMNVYKVVREEVEEGVTDAEATPEITNYKEYLEKQIKDNPNITFEEAVGDMAKFDEFLRNRLEAEYKNFRKKLSSISSDSDLSTYLQFGLADKFGQKGAQVAKSADLLNLKDDDLNYNLRQIFFSNWLNTTAINQVLLGDTAISLSDAIDEIKRAKMQNAAYDSAATIISAQEYGIEHPVQQMNLFAFTEPSADATFTKGNKTDYADAQLWMTTKAFRYMWFGFGKLSASQAKLLDMIERGEKVPYDELLGNADKTSESYAKISAMLNSKKLVYGDGQTFVKMSAFTLTKEYTSRQDENGNWVAKENKVELHNLRERMENFEKEQWKKGIGTLAMAAPVSALKMMKENVQDITEALSTDAAFTADQSMQLDANFMGLQTITPSNKLIITDPTQVKTLVTSEQNDNEIVILNGEEIPIGKIREQYNQSVKDRVSLKYLNRRNLVFNFDIDFAMDMLKASVREGEIKPDLYVYLKYASQSLEASNATSNILEMFSTDENGQQKYNLNNPQTVKKFEELFLSFFSKGVLSEKTTGISMTLASDLGVRVYRRVLSVDENGMPDRQEVIREDVWDRMANKPEIAFNIDEGANNADDKNLTGLAAAVEEAGSEGVVILDRLRSNLKEYDSEGKWTRQRYTEMIMPPHHTEVGELIADTDASIPDVVSKMFGVRIPSQDNHSTVNLKVVDFMPGYYGSTGVFARELIEVSGADFDIDKVYISTKDFYVNEAGEFAEYGKADTEDGQYQDYVRAMNADVKQPGSSLSQALLKYKNSGGIRSLSDTEKEMASDAGFEENTIKALQAAGLPISFDEYTEYKEKHKAEPYTQAMNNDILDQKFALMGNDYVTNTPGRDVAISHEPADTKPLEDLLEDLADEIPYFANILANENMDVDNLLGKLLSFDANKSGANSIGAVVLPNLYLNLMQEYGSQVLQRKVGKQKTTVELELNGIPYNDFSVTEDSNGDYRTQYVISALITAMTDNAKLRLSSKLGLNRDALGVVANMTALGVPIKTSILLVNHPTLRELYFKAINKEEEFDPGIATLVRDRLELLETTFGDIPLVEVTNDLLSEEINENLSDVNADNIQKLMEDGVFTVEKAMKEYSILKQFQVAHNIKTYTGNLGGVLNLAKGLGKDIAAMNSIKQQVSALGLDLTEKEYQDYVNDRIDQGLPVIDVRDLFKNTWQGGYLEIFNEIKDKILPNVFISQTEVFQDVLQKALLQVPGYKQTNEFVDTLQMDLLAYLTIKAYSQKLLNSQSGMGGSLSNSIMYPQLEGEKITEVVERLRESNPNNFFLENFVILESAMDDGNKSGLDRANANTFNRLNDSNKVVLQSSFARLYGNLETRKDAMKIIHYIMVKDGMKLGYGSLLEAITPFTYNEFLAQINTAESALRGRSKEKFFETTFGLSYQELVDEFIKGYFKNGRNRANIQQGYNIRTYNPVQTTGSVQSSPYKPHVVKVNSETLYVFGDVAAGVVKDGNRAVRDLANTFGIVYKKNLADVEDNYYTEEEFDAWTSNTEQALDALEALISQYNDVVFPKFLIPQKEVKALKKNSPQVFNYLKEALKNRFNYDLVAGTKGKVSASKGANRLPIYIDETGDVARLKVNTFPGQRITETTENVALRKPSLAKKKDNTFSLIKKTGFKTTNVKVGINSYMEAVLPYAYRINVGTREAPRYRYFVLNKYQSVAPKTLTATTLPTGNYAEYVEFFPEGSPSQWAGAFMFSNENEQLPSTAEVRQFVKNANEQEGDLEGALDNIPDDFDFGDAPSNATKAIENGASVVFDGKNLTVDGVPAAEVTDAQVDKLAAAENVADDREVTQDDINRDNAAITSLLNNLGTANENKYGDLTEFWDNNIQLNRENKAKLAEQNINSLEDFIQAYKDGTYDSEESFLDEINNCIL